MVSKVYYKTNEIHITYLMTRTKRLTRQKKLKNNRPLLVNKILNMFIKNKQSSLICGSDEISSKHIWMKFISFSFVFLGQLVSRILTKLITNGAPAGSQRVNLALVLEFQSELHSPCSRHPSNCILGLICIYKSRGPLLYIFDMKIKMM
jgi:hypothetical protein